MLLIIASLVVLLIVLFTRWVIGRLVRVRVINTFITESLLHLDVFLGSRPSEHPSPQYRPQKRHLAASLNIASSARLLQSVRHSVHVVVRHLRCRLVGHWQTRVGRRMP